jgi:hypothetical protein
VFHADLQAVVEILDGHVQPVVQPIPIPVQQGKGLAAEVLERPGKQIARRIVHSHTLGKMCYGAAHRGDQAVIAGKMQNRTRMFTSHCGSPV